MGIVQAIMSLDGYVAKKDFTIGGPVRLAAERRDSGLIGHERSEPMRTLHVGLRVADLKQSIPFYTSLGYEVLGEVSGTELGTLTMLKLPNDEFVALELVHDPAHGPVEPSGISHLVIQVDDVHATVAHLAGRGVWAAEPASPDGSAHFWTAWVTDPDGYRIELVQWPQGHPDGMTRSDLTQRGYNR